MLQVLVCSLGSGLQPKRMEIAAILWEAGIAVRNPPHPSPPRGRAPYVSRSMRQQPSDDHLSLLCSRHAHCAGPQLNSCKGCRAHMPNATESLRPMLNLSLCSL